MPREAAAALVLSTLTGDFREVLPRIRVPMLCVGAEESHLKGAMPWIASQIPGAKLTMAKGRHFSLVEEPARFAADVLQFIQDI